MYKLLLLLPLALLIFSCAGTDSGSAGSSGSNDVSMSEANLKDYLRAYTKLKSETKAMLEAVNQKKKVSDHAQYAQFESIIKEHGFESYEAFEQYNVKTAVLFSMVQGRKANDDFKNTAKNAKGIYDEGIAEIDKQLNDPSVPESAKAELRKAKEELKKGKSQTSNYAEPKNAKSWEDDVIEKFNQRSKWKISKSEFILVSKFEQDLAEAYQDLTLPRMMEDEEL